MLTNYTKYEEQQQQSNTNQLLYAINFNKNSSQTYQPGFCYFGILLVSVELRILYNLLKGDLWIFARFLVLDCFTFEEVSISSSWFSIQSFKVESTSDSKEKNHSTYGHNKIGKYRGAYDVINMFFKYFKRFCIKTLPNPFLFLWINA